MVRTPKRTKGRIRKMQEFNSRQSQAKSRKNLKREFFRVHLIIRPRYQINHYKGTETLEMMCCKFSKSAFIFQIIKYLNQHIPQQKFIIIFITTIIFK